MKYQLLKRLLLSSFVVLPINIQAAWEPTFVDNFNGNTIKQKSWVIGRENLPQRLHYYHKDAVEVKGGKLNIKVLNRSVSDRPYTTGAVTTQGLFAQKYGYFEIRAKIPKGDGFWPAFWLMPTSGKWTSEIDIVEFIGDKPETPHYAFHYDYSQKNQHSFAANAGKDLSLGYNTYGLNWTPNKLEYYLNGKLMHTIQGSYIVGKADSPMYVILNMALASRYTGWIKAISKHTDISQAYSVDYIRVFKQSPTGKYQSIPAPLTPIADKLSNTNYDNTPISIEAVVEPGFSDVMRTSGFITGKMKLSAHAPLNAEVKIALFKIKEFNQENGRYLKSSPIEITKKQVSFSKAGESLTIPYKFGKYINSSGAYIVDVVVRDNNQGHRNAVSAHRVVQFLDKAHPETTACFNGFIRGGSASYLNGKVNSTINLMLHESLLSPYVQAFYSITDNKTKKIVKYKKIKSYLNKPGSVSLKAVINAELDSSGSYSMAVYITDSSGKFRLEEFSLPITAGKKTYSSQSATLATNDILHALYGVKSAPDFSIIFDTTLAKGAQFNNLNYNVKLYSIKDGAFIRKISGTYTRGIVNGRQSLKITTNGGYGMTASDYRAKVMLYRDGWNPSDLVVEKYMDVHVPDRNK